MKKRNNFTLVELMVAMGVFVVLLMVSMQIFGGARKLWVRSEQKNNTFAAARAAMEFIAGRVQACAYTAEVPFAIYGRKGGSGQEYYTKIYFPTSVPMNRKNESDGKDLDFFDLRFIGFSLLEEDGVLEMRIFSDRRNGDGKYPYFSRLIPPFNRPGRRALKTEDNVPKLTYTAACSEIDKKLNPEAGGASTCHPDDKLELIENVTSFKLISFNTPAKTAKSKIKRDNASKLNTPPYLLEIEISVIDSKANFKKWKEAGSEAEKVDIETESGYTFRRAVLLGDRRY